MFYDLLFSQLWRKRVGNEKREEDNRVHSLFVSAASGEEVHKATIQIRLCGRSRRALQSHSILLYLQHDCTELDKITLLLQPERLKRVLRI